MNLFNLFSSSEGRRCAPRYLLFAACAMMTLPAQAQVAPLQCAYNAAVTPTIRGEGITELIGDVVLNCTGGTPTPAGQAVPQMNLTVSLNSNLTSRITQSEYSYSEVLMLIDEPHSATNPSTPLVVCDAACSINGVGNGIGTYNGTPGRPNVFQARQTGVNQITFFGIPMDPPGSLNTRLLRITNLRANANQLGVSPTLMPTMVVANVSVSPPNLLPLNNPQQTVAFIATGTTAAVSSRPTLKVCTAANPAIAADPSKPLDSGGQNGQQFTVRLTEGFPAAWREKNIAVHLGNSATGPATYPDVAAQDVPGANYFSESGFLANGVSPNVSGFGPMGYGPFLPASSVFPMDRGLAYAGVATAGARLMVRLTNIPAGVRILVPNRTNFEYDYQPWPPGSEGFAVLTAADASGGAFSPLSGNSAGLTALPVAAGAAVAVYEVLYASPFDMDRAAIPIAIAYAPNVPVPSGITVEAGLGTVDSTGVASFDAPIPRFAPLSNLGVGVVIDDCAPLLAITKTHSGNFRQGQAGAYTIVVSNHPSEGPTSTTVFVTETLPAGLILRSMSGDGWTCVGDTCSRSDVLLPGASYPSIAVTVDVAADAGTALVSQAEVSGGGSVPASATDSATVLPALNATGLRFVPIPPCRIADTRLADGAFGGPSLVAGATRDFDIPASACGVPRTAAAYALNVTVVPQGPLGYLTVWPTGEAQPNSSTLNSHDGRIKANAAIVAAGGDNAVSVFATHATHLVLDINGYFVPASDSTALAFYPMPPCRVVDTRVANGPFGSPALAAGSTRSFPVLASECNVPVTAQAYSLNMTVVPKGPFSYLSTWPAGQAKPEVSTLNAPTGTITANAAIVPAGNGGAIETYVTQETELVIDINGYFAPPAAEGLSLYAMAPCRVIDTRQPTGSPAWVNRTDIPVAASACALPGAAQAYVFNATVVPSEALGYLTLWPGGPAAMPTVSTLNASDATVTSNMAIVPASSGAIGAFQSNLSHLVMDIFGYFAP